MNQMTLPSGADWPPGFRVNPRAVTLDPALIEAYRGVPSCHAGDVMGRHTGAIGLRAWHEDLTAVLCGPAVTVRVRPGDNLMIHLAMMMAEPGDVIVVDGGGDLSTALVGGLMRTTAIARGIAGFVIDGALRDVAEWADGRMPAYARGSVLRGPTKEGPGEVNVPVAIGGLSVAPGDLILADADGVIAIPSDRAAALLPACLDHAEKERRIAAKNATGALDHERFATLLRARGCPV